MSDEHQRRAAPPPPVFLNYEERDFVRQINNEILEHIIGQEVVYYPISTELSNFHEVYGECLIKTFDNPVVVAAAVKFEGDEERGGGIADRKSKLRVSFHKRRLTEDQDLYVRLGDFILWGTRFYEIVALEEPKELWGNPDYKFEINAICIQSRKGKFNAT